MMDTLIFSFMSRSRVVHDVFKNNVLEPEVLIKTEVIDEDLGPADGNETVFIAHSNGYSTNKCH